MGVVIVILQLVSVIAGSILLAASILNLFTDEIVFWPPPFEGSWQHRTFLLLFRVMFYSLVALSSVLIWLQGLTVSISIFCVGLFLMVFGFGIALLATGLLGWRQASAVGGAAVSRETIGTFLDADLVVSPTAADAGSAPPASMPGPFMAQNESVVVVDVVVVVTIVVLLSGAIVVGQTMVV